MNESLVTLSGWLGNDVTVRPAGDAQVASFRLASTPRRFNPRSEQWYDADTQWYTVNAWRVLGQHCADSLRRGDPVVVHGKLSAQRWTSSAGVEMTTFEIEAAFVGHDLNRGTTVFAKTTRAVPAGAEGAEVGESGESGEVAEVAEVAEPPVEETVSAA